MLRRTTSCGFLLWAAICAAAAPATSAFGQKQPASPAAPKPSWEGVLNRLVTVDFADTPLDQLFVSLAKTAQVPIEVDPGALESANVEVNQAVWIKVRDVPLRSLLDLILEPLGLAWVVRDEALLITSHSAAKQAGEIQFYTVAALLRALGGGDDAYEELVMLLTSVVEPTAWDEAGGSGSMHRLPNLLAVETTRDVHAELLEFLAELDQAYGLKPRAAPPASPSLAAVRKALEADAAFEFEEAKLTDVCEQIDKQYGISIVLDRQAMEEANVAADVPVTASVPRAPLKRALGQLLERVGLTWTVFHDVLWITTPGEAENDLEREIYHVGDLLDRQRPGAMDRDDLVEFVTGTVSPSSWEDVGGPGSLISAPKGVWIVLQAPEVHDRLTARLTELRGAVKAGEAEVRQLPAAPKGAASKPALKRVVYRILGLVPEDVVEAVQGTIAPTSWSGRGGPGTIYIVRPEPPPAATAATEPAREAEQEPAKSPQVKSPDDKSANSKAPDEKTPGKPPEKPPAARDQPQPGAPPPAANSGAKPQMVGLFRAPQPSNAAQAPVLLIVNQTAAVHREIAKFLAELEQPQSSSASM